jgi:hypothetical protein
LAKFQKGQSGNPGGRPAGVATMRARIYAECGDDAKKLVEALVLVGTGTQAAIRKKFGAKAAIKERVAAISELLDRGWGKAPQSIEIDGKDGKPIRVVFGGRHRAADAGADGPPTSAR